jgi:hypothetical protein
MIPFEYPVVPYERRHGPAGYTDYSSYRPWLRDEFCFRCVYCYIREQWGRITGEFDLDHFHPQILSPELSVDYDNLLYACHSCNLLKGNRQIPDPCTALIAGSVRVNPDGSLEATSDEALRIIEVLGLNSESYKEWRLIWIRITELARDNDPELCRRLLSFPADLPDLSRLRPPGGNARAEGLQASHFAKKERGELAETY